MSKPLRRDYIQCIYGLSGPDGKTRYIGKSEHVNQTVAKFRTAARKNSYPTLDVYKWIAEIGIENLQINIIERLMTHDRQLGNERRAYYIAMYTEMSSRTTPLLNKYAPKKES